MKTLLIALFTLFTANVFAVIGAPVSNQFDNTGTLIRKDQEYIIVKNGGVSSISRGRVVTYDTSADNGATIGTSTTRGNPLAACITEVAIAAGASGKCQVYGYHDAVYFDAQYTPATAGSYLYVSGTTAGSVDAYSGETYAKIQLRPVAVALDAASATGEIEAFIILK